MTATLQLGDQIKAARLDAGLGLRELGRLAGIHWNTIKGYEGGKKIPADKFLQLADALNHHSFRVDGNEFTVTRADSTTPVSANREQLKLDFTGEYGYSRASVRIGPGKITVSFDGVRSPIRPKTREIAT